VEKKSIVYTVRVLFFPRTCTFGSVDQRNSDPQVVRRNAYNSLGKVMSKLFHVAKRSYYLSFRCFSN
jgi:hypothetical protein